METDIEVIKTQFRNSAARIFSLISDDFKRNVKGLDRQRDENVFQKIKGRYIDELESQLKQLAEKTISQYSGDKDINILRRQFSREVSYHVSELLMKTRSM